MIVDHMEVLCIAQKIYNLEITEKNHVSAKTGALADGYITSKLQPRLCLRLTDLKLALHVLVLV